MGKLLSLLSRDDSAGTCCGPAGRQELWLDLENAAPATDTERRVFEAVQTRVLSRADSALQLIHGYRGAGREIREAIATPGPDTEQRAARAVRPLVARLRRCYDLSVELERVMPQLLGALCGGGLSPAQHLETQQALVKQLAEILEFVLKFDELKVRHVTHNTSLLTCCHHNSHTPHNLVSRNIIRKKWLRLTNL